MKWKTTISNLLEIGIDDSQYRSRYNEDVLSAFATFRNLYVKLLRSTPKVHIHFHYASFATEIHPNVDMQAEELTEQVKKGKKSAEIISVSFLSQCMISLILHKPDSARARPSTLLTKDETYFSLYDHNQDLDVFYHAAKLGRMTEICLKRLSGYSQAQVNDILFYTLYYEVGQLLCKSDIMTADVKSLDLAIFTDDYILCAAKNVFEEYIRLGGNSQVAKGSLLIENPKKQNFLCCSTNRRKRNSGNHIIIMEVSMEIYRAQPMKKTSLA